MSYSHSSIWIQHREVDLPEILSGKASPLSEFEAETFLFIRDWLQGVDSFKLQTSGSTGTPKETTLTRNQLQQSAKRTIQALNLNQNDTALVCLDTKYVAGKMMLVRALESNMKIIAIEPSSNPLLTLSNETTLSFAAFVPLQLLEMLKDPHSVHKLNQLKAVIVGGSAVSASLQQEISKLSSPVFATYGMTETVSHIALQRLNGEHPSEHFTVLPGIETGVDERGCLVIQLPEFQEKIVTHDLVEILSPGNFKWLGRHDNVINSGGFKISPEKIEKLIDRIFQERKVNRSFFVYGIPDNRLGQKRMLLIVGFPISGGKKVLAELQRHLHPYEVPKQIFHIREFIRTETGKINRAKTAALIE
jgi:O-succinylbenzoic acid--CoA ligase